MELAFDFHQMYFLCGKNTFMILYAVNNYYS